MNQLKNQQLTITDKQLFTDSFNVCLELLKRNNYYLNERNNDIFSTLSLNYGHDMYDAMKIVMKKIIKSNHHKVAIEKIKTVISNDTSNTDNDDDDDDDDYDDDDDDVDDDDDDDDDDKCVDNNNKLLLDGLNQKQQVDKVTRQIELNQDDRMIPKKRKTLVKVDTIHSKKKFKSNVNKNCTYLTVKDQKNSLEMCEKNVKDNDFDDSINNKNKQMKSLAIHLLKINNTKELYENSKRLKIQSNQTSSQDNYNQSCSNKIINNINHQRSTRISTGSITRKKYCNLDINSKENSDDDYKLTVNKFKQNKNPGDKIKKLDRTSLEKKLQVVKLAIQNPSWPIRKLRKHTGCHKLAGRYQIIMWANQLKQGGSRSDKCRLINNWVYKNCINYHKNGKKITINQIFKWALEAKKIFKFDKFIAGKTWLRTFRNKNGITGNVSDLKMNLN